MIFSKLSSVGKSLDKCSIPQLMTIVITGATKGIGRAIAEQFATPKTTLFVCARNHEDLKALKVFLQQQGAKVYIKKADVSKRKQVIAFADFITKHTDKIDILVNNAGMFQQGTITEEAEGLLEQMINTNLYSAYHLTRALLPLLYANPKGHIFNMCSIASEKAFPTASAYSISKFALLGFSKVLREELKNKNIKVTSLMPGATWSNAWAGVTLPKERIMQAKDIAKVVWSAYQLGDSAVVEEIVIRPQLGDL